MLNAPTKSEPIRLNFREADRKVLVEPENEDRFITTVGQAAVACQVADREARFYFQVRNTLLQKLWDWLRAHRNQVESAFLAVREGGLLFLVVRDAAAYDAVFEDELTDLDLQIAREPGLDLVSLEVGALPKVSRETAISYMGPKAILVVFYRA